MTAASSLHAALDTRGETVGCAESLTGGELAALLSATPGASRTFVGGVVTYATELKRRLLQVTASEVVSAECAVQMATGARELLDVDWALATTGVAGPDLQEGQPAGTVFVGLAGRDRARFVRLTLGGDREAIRTATCLEAVDLLLEEVTRG
ncbi:MAG: CinA family protein [Marmoricola sp.]